MSETSASQPNRGYPEPDVVILSPTDAFQAFTEHGRAASKACNSIAAWPEYKPTPLLSFPALAREVGVAELVCKYEGHRLGLDSFKALGASYATLHAICRAIGEEPSADTRAELMARATTGSRLPISIVCASDGNHGYSVASVAAQLGCRSRVFLPTAVSTERERRIASAGAEVVRVRGVYEDAQAMMRSEAALRGHLVVSDYSDDPTEQCSIDCMAAYALLARELVEQRLATSRDVTHVLIPTGCGAFAAAISLYLKVNVRQNTPRIILVEPSKADCVRQALVAGKRLRIEGNLETIMGGLACASISASALPILQATADAVVVIDDAWVIPAMRAYAHPSDGNEPLGVGETGASALAAVLALAAAPAQAARIGLNSESRIVVIACEGVTDPALYEQLVPTHRSNVTNKPA
jgi:diaminopropionate ammonia-lyase